MLFIEDYSDQRQKSWCIHCGAAIVVVEANRDHVPSKLLLSKALRRRGAKFDRGCGEPDDYLPQVVICKRCNSQFSRDETYLLCLLHALCAGSLYPDPKIHPVAANVLRSNRDIIRALKDAPGGQMLLFNDLQPFTLYPDSDRISNVILKNARGHVYHELGEPVMEDPANMFFVPLMSMANEEKVNFEEIGDGLDVCPEVGSRMVLRVIEGEGLAGGWVVVEEGKYRYAVDWSSGIMVRTVIWEYLATETRWAT
ncbi:MAG: hypothetical protein OXC41_02195 [Gammaproteobacteria bacterium]|nr:hypothetical protein [Gammaproteobacteria bacterium]